METNSIKTNISQEDIVSEIKLSLGADSKKEAVIVLVEGDDDFKFLRKLVTNNVDIIESFSGKIGIKEIIENYFDDELRVIGIRDRDYEKKLAHDRIFFYDYSCWEMMVVSYQELFENIYYEYYMSGSISHNELFNILLNNIRHISLIRKYNEENGLGINFKGISMSNIIENCKASIDKLLVELKRKNPDLMEIIPDFKVMLEEKLKESCNTNELLNLTQGHDFIGIFQHYCKRDRGKDPSKDDISASLRCIFGESYFKKTNLYKLLTKYEYHSKLKIVSN